MKKLLIILLISVSALAMLAQSVWINEVYYDTPITGDAGAFVELKGIPGASLDGFTLYGVNGNGGAVYNTIDLTGYSIPADSYFVITDDTLLIPTYDMISSLVDYQNGPDNIILDSSGIMMDAVGYGDFSAAVFSGFAVATYDVYVRPLIRVGKNLINYYDYLGAGVITPGFGNQGTLITDIDSVQFNWGASPLVDSIVMVRGMVTAVFPDDSLYYIQAGPGEWKGIEVRDGRADSVAIGDSIAAWGLVFESYDKTRIEYTMSFTQSTGHTPQSTVMAINSVGENVEGQLITISNATVLNDSIGFGEWEITDQNGDTLVIDDRAGNYITPATGTNLSSITGVLDYTYSVFKLQPRSQSDIVEGYDIDGTVGLSDNPADSSGTLVTIAELALSDSTDASGTYQFTFVPAGTYTFVFDHSGYVSDTIIDTITGNETVNTTLDPVVLIYNITGTVGLSDNPADSSNSIVTVTELSIKDTTDVHGYYEFLGLSTGIYTLIFEHAGYVSDTVTDTLDGDHDIDITLLSLAGIDNEMAYPLISNLEYSGNGIIFNLGKNSENDMDISLIDMSGRIIDRVSVNGKPGLYRVNMKKSLANGAYFLHIHSDSERLSHKIVILK